MRDKKISYNILININFFSISVSDSTKINILFIMNTHIYFISYSDIFLTYNTYIILLYII